jgi:alkylglycerol monooxygenase
MNKYLIYIIPVLLFFVLVELLADVISHRKVYRFEDTITNISLGFGQQVIEALFKTVFSFLFLWVYKYSIFAIPDTIGTFLGVVLICDFIFYWFHRLSHTINILWAIHIVHHQSNEYNFSVSLRQPWLHKFAIFAFFLVLPFIGVSPTIMVLAFAFQTFYQFWLHTRFIGKLGILEKYLVTPSHHRVHHGANDKYLNKNYGNTLIIWDKLFGTFQGEDEPVVFGTTESFTSTNPFWANIFFWKVLAKNSKKQKKITEKIKLYFQKLIPHTGKQKTGVKAEPLRLIIPHRLTWYIIVQYLLIFIFAFFYLLKQDNFSIVWKIISALFIFWSIYNFSALIQRKKDSIFWELIRIIVMGLLGYLFLFF